MTEKIILNEQLHGQIEMAEVNPVVYVLLVSCLVLQLVDIFYKVFILYDMYVYSFCEDLAVQY